jgi:putative copper resistance protein D
MAPGPLTPIAFFTHPQLQPVALVAVAGSTGWYLLARRRVLNSGKAWRAWRTAAFLAGELVILVASASGLLAFAQTNFSALATWYASLGIVGPGLVALGAPLRLGDLASLGSPPEPDAAGGDPVGAFIANRFVRAVTFPLVTWVAFATSGGVFFFTGLVGDTLANTWVAQASTVALVLIGLAFWWVVVAADRAPWKLGYWQRIFYLLMAFPLFGVLGMTLQSETSRIAPYISLGSLHLGAAALWVAGETVALYATIAVFVQWLRDDERNAVAHDQASEAAAARQLALWRASRDAAARAR